MKQGKWWILGGFVVLAVTFTGVIMSQVEQAKYSVIESYGQIEIRDYEGLIAAEVEVSGERKEAINKGFRLIANYIFGNNSSSQKVAMTAPVSQEQSEKIAMTAPVTQQGSENLWTVRFFMPRDYSIQTLPKPNNNLVTLKELPPKRFAVIRFSGFPTEKSLQKHTEKLEELIKRQKLQALSSPISLIHPGRYLFSDVMRLWLN
jgi:hypothetical protein